MTEAARGALAVAFERLLLPEIVSFTALGNVRSRAVMERIGMRNVDDPLRFHCLYRLGIDAWRTARGATPPP